MKTDCCVFVEVSLGVVGGGTRLSSSERGWTCPSCDWGGHPGHLLLLLLFLLLQPGPCTWEEWDGGDQSYTRPGADTELALTPLGCRAQGWNSSQGERAVGSPCPSSGSSCEPPAPRQCPVPPSSSGISATLILFPASFCPLHSCSTGLWSQEQPRESSCVHG